jgi:hypothetical protein
MSSAHMLELLAASADGCTEALLLAHGFAPQAIVGTIRAGLATRQFDLMAKPPTPETIAAALTVPKRVLLFCLASDTDWTKASVTHATAQHMMIRGLIEREQGARRFVLTEQGRAILAALLRGRD